MLRENRHRVADASEIRWSSMPADDVLTRLETRPEGLTHEEAEQRLGAYGLNRLREAQRLSALHRFARQFNNVIIYILIAASIITAALGHWIDSGIIAAVVLINAGIGYFQEGKAERALEAIRHMLTHEASVLRAGERETVPAESLVPGDVVILEAGDKVPADMRLFRVRELRIDEAVLTGESLPVRKSTDPSPEDAALGDQRGMAFSSTLVTAGSGMGVVTGTGDRTEIGRISSMLAGVRKLSTPLLDQFSHFGRWLSAGVVVLALLAFLIGTFLWDQPAGAMFLAAVGLAVAAIPEGLPAILTITLAIGVQRMARRNAIIRHLPAVDTLGSVTVICTDKTGTLTRNEMTVGIILTPHRRYAVTGVGYAPKGNFHDDGEVNTEPGDDLLAVLRAAMLCSDARIHHHKGQWILHGDPTEGALVTVAMKAELDPYDERRRWPRLDAIPFESEHKFMATLHHDHTGRKVVHLKGAPERVIEMCQWEGDRSPIDRRRWHDSADQLAAQGYRVLAMAYKPAPENQLELRFSDLERDLVLLGLVGMSDPPRPEAIAAIDSCQQAGVRVKMITGDHTLTASAIGKQLNIGNGEKVLSGPELEKLDDAQMRDAVRDIDIFARVNPEHKLRLVEAIQAEKQVVAMTGDGVNDAPALKRADVGIAMGHKGTQVSREAADMVLADDNFASIASAVEEGRTVYANLQKAIVFILPTNGGQALVILAAVLLGFQLPITPVQILWVNMVTAVTLSLSMAFEPPEPNIMRCPPRNPRQHLLTPFFLWRIVFVSMILWAGTFGLFVWLRLHVAELEVARTVAINTLVLFQVFYLFNARSITDSVLNRRGLLGNRYALLAVATVLALQMMYTYIPLSNRLFETAPLALAHWTQIIPVAASVFVLVELEKWIVRQRLAQRGAAG